MVDEFVDAYPEDSSQPDYRETVETEEVVEKLQRAGEDSFERSLLLAEYIVRAHEDEVGQSGPLTPEEVTERIGEKNFLWHELTSQEREVAVGFANLEIGDVAEVEIPTILSRARHEFMDDHRELFAAKDPILITGEELAHLVLGFEMRLYKQDLINIKLASKQQGEQ
jgi:hypothetical protein